MTLLARAQGLSELIEREADRSESDATLSPVVVEALHESGLFGLMVPKELGGEEADLPTVIEVYEEVCRADGSTGWTLLANATTSAFAAAYTGPAAVDAMFDGTRVAGRGRSVLSAWHRGARRRRVRGQRPLQLRERQRARAVDRRWRARAARR